MSGSSVWIFGFGSLIYNPGDLRYTECRDGWVRGYERRFYQGSTDHRGVPGAPGRVLMLERAQNGACVWGRAYRVSGVDLKEVLAYLDHREKCGYSRFTVDLFASPEDPFPALSDVYVYNAPPENPEYLGPAPADELAAHIAHSVGPSGRNSDYLFRVAEALRDAGIQDDHVHDLEDRVRRLLLEL